VPVRAVHDTTLCHAYVEAGEGQACRRAGVVDDGWHGGTGNARVDVRKSRTHTVRVRGGRREETMATVRSVRKLDHKEQVLIRLCQNFGPKVPRVNQADLVDVCQVDFSFGLGCGCFVIVLEHL
jgi:hypothetical protein